MVLDRIFLWMFTIACIVGKSTKGNKNKNMSALFDQVFNLRIFVLPGTTGIIMAAPSHYDARQPIDVLHSKIDKMNTLKSALEEM